MTREELLTEMGLTIWRLRDYRGALPAAAVRAAPAGAGAGGPRETATNGTSAANAANAASAANAADVAPTVTARPGPPDRFAAAPARPALSRTQETADDGDWVRLEAEIRACRACGLCERRRQAVPGVGDRQADWLFVGEGPGAEEDEQGEPFVGQAGKLLDAMLRSIGLERGQNVYIANAVKCRPPGNRTPEAAEMAACRPFLERQVALLRPRLIVLLGRAAAQSVLGSDETLSALRGRRFAFGDIPVLVTYHPAYLLRTPLDKAKVWEDLCRARSLMRDAGRNVG